jgi:hypothetical protein
MFNSTMLLNLIKGAYKVPIKMTGKSVAKGERNIKTRGPSATAGDFYKEKKFITNDPARELTSA